MGRKRMAKAQPCPVCAARDARIAVPRPVEGMSQMKVAPAGGILLQKKHVAIAKDKAVMAATMLDAKWKPRNPLEVGILAGGDSLPLRLTRWASYEDWAPWIELAEAHTEYPWLDRTMPIAMEIRQSEYMSDRERID